MGYTVERDELTLAVLIFFWQAEDGIRDKLVTGVQTCALPIAARRLLDAGAAVALATDFNPGSSPTVSLPLVMALAVSQLGLRHAEVIHAVTVNAAAALRVATDRGQIAPGFRADLVLCGVSDWREVAYWMGVNPVTAVWTGGSACPLRMGPVSLGTHVEAL